MRQKLTVLIPCKNEERHIAACIASARAVADEILVADSGSTDATMDIVRAQGDCRLIEREFIDFANFKNWAIPQASHPWVLIVDSDERISLELAEEILQILEKPPSSIDGYWIGRQNFFLGHPLNHGSWNTDDVCRLIRRDVCRYAPCRVHEEIDISSERSSRTVGKLYHYTNLSYDQVLPKYERYTDWKSQDMWDAGKRATFLRMAVSPVLRFLQLYVLRGGFLDGWPGLQMAMLMAFHNTYMKQARLWEAEHALSLDELEARYADKVASVAGANEWTDQKAA